MCVVQRRQVSQQEGKGPTEGARYPDKGGQDSRRDVDVQVDVLTDSQDQLPGRLRSTAA